MGCSASKATVVVTEPRNGLLAATPSAVATPSVLKKSPRKDANPVLDPDQAAQLRQSWSQLCENSTIATLGKHVFLHIFELRPEVKKIFPFGNAWGDELIKHPLFQAHAERFMVIIETAIVHLECLKSEYGDMLFKLGRSHAHFEGFTKDNFDIFYKSIFFVWQQELKGTMDTETETAWRALLDYILGQQRAGYMAETKAMVKNTLEVTKGMAANHTATSGVQIPA